MAKYFVQWTCGPFSGSGIVSAVTPDKAKESFLIEGNIGDLLEGYSEEHLIVAKSFRPLNTDKYREAKQGDKPSKTEIVSRFRAIAKERGFEVKEVLIDTETDFNIGGLLLTFKQPTSQHIDLSLIADSLGCFRMNSIIYRLLSPTQMEVEAYIFMG